MAPSLETCEIFFVEKIGMIRSSYPTPFVEKVMTSIFVRSFELFDQVLLAQDIIIRLKPTSGGYDVVPLLLFKEILDVGPSITSIINSSLFDGVVLMGLK